MAGTFTNLIYHLIFSTKNRRGIIDEDLYDDLYRYIGGIIRGEGGVLLAAGGTPNHIHLVARFKPTTSVSEMLRKIKGNASKWLGDNPRCRVPFAWQNGFGAFSVSGSQLSDVLAYVQDQAEHHRECTFKEEFVAFLEKHKIEYDNRYIWE